MNKYHITPEEAIALFANASMGDVLTACDICDAYAQKQRHPADAQSFAYGACFYAGIIEGVRRERAKRRRASHA